ncbi:hypothetical protein NFC81_09025 [Salinispirillum sp. LH 10-3-1]|uniref:Phage MuF C-terminal domain-containing protein n=1 Tax=Salinispirillum sp. LH 10-3-1 TaxID=2952525 RepID=A0AB38YC09_9GAMM
MTPNWSAYTQTDEYKSLSPDQRAQASDLFFQQVVAPNVPESEREQARAAWQSATAPAPSTYQNSFYDQGSEAESTINEPGLMGDTARSVGAGFVGGISSMAKGAEWLADRATEGDVPRISPVLDRAADHLREGRSQATKDAVGNFAIVGDGQFSLRGLGQSVAEGAGSLPALALGGGPIGAGTRVGLRAAGVGEKAARTAGAMTGYSAAGSLMGGSGSLDEVQQEILNADLSILAEAPAFREEYQKLYQQNPEGDHAEMMTQAREMLAVRMGDESFGGGAARGAVLYGMLGPAYERLFRGVGGALQSVKRGAGTEFVQEGADQAISQAQTNMALTDIDGRPVSQNVLARGVDSGIIGAISGGAVGGATGGIAKLRPDAEQQLPTELASQLNDALNRLNAGQTTQQDEVLLLEHQNIIYGEPTAESIQARETTERSMTGQFGQPRNTGLEGDVIPAEPTNPIEPVRPPIDGEGYEIRPIAQEPRREIPKLDDDLLGLPQLDNTPAPDSILMPDAEGRTADPVLGPIPGDRAFTARSTTQPMIDNPAPQRQREEVLSALADAMASVDQMRSEQVRPSVKGSPGIQTRVKVGDHYEPATFMLIDLADNPTVRPQIKKSENQNRDRTRAAYQQQVQAIANNLDFNELGASARMSEGAPTVTKEGVIIGGNGRVSAILEAYRNETATQYREELERRAGEFGVDASSIRNMKQPALVRRFDRDVDVAMATMRSNEQTGARMSALEQARIDGDIIQSIPNLRVSDDGKINTPENFGFFRQFVSALPVNERNDLVKGSGALSQAGLNRIQNALMYKAYGDTDVLAQLIEGADDGGKNIHAALLRAAPHVASVRSAIDRGELHDLDVSAEIVQAVALYNDMGNRGQSINDYLAQGDMVGGISTVAKSIAQVFDAKKRSAKSMADFIIDFYDRIQALGSPDQAGLFGDANPSVQDYLSQSADNVGVILHGQEANTANTNEDRAAEAGDAGRITEEGSGQRETGPIPEIELTAQTEQDAANTEAANAAFLLSEEKAQRDADSKRKADSEANDFRLSGSDAVADIAAAGGQANLLDRAASDTNTSPTEAQKEAGNYKKGRVTIQGLNIAIENPKGSTRSGTSPDGVEWSNTMAHHYGYINRTEGADGDQVDVFIGDNPESDRVFVIDQVNADGRFDEHKVMMGFDTQAEAVKGYKANYDRGWKVGPVTDMSMDEFKQWLKEGETDKPLIRLRSTGQPFATAKAASLSRAFRESRLAKAVEVDGGFGVAVLQSGRGIPDDFSTAIEHVAVGSLKTGIDKIESAEDAAHLFAPIRKHGQETLMAAVLNDKGKVLNVLRHSKGAKDSSSFNDIEMVSAVVGTKGARRVWLSHNHPSGKSEPSSSDRIVTERFNKLLDGTGIELAGHVVVGIGGKAHVMNQNGGNPEEIRITPRTRKLNVPVTERIYRKNKPSDFGGITMPFMAVEAASQMDSKNGLLLLNNQNELIGNLPLRSSEMISIRDSDAANRILKAIDRSNAAAIIIKAEHKPYARNMSKFLNRFNGLRVLDVILPDATGKLESAEAGSARGLASDTGDFYSAISGSPFRPVATEATAYREALQKMISTKRTQVKPATLGRSSPVLRAMGAPDLPMTITLDVVRKATNGVKHDVPMSVIEQLPELLHDPVAVFNGSESGSLLVLVNAMDSNGAPVVSAVHFKKAEGRLEVNRLASVYGKDNPRVLARHELRYLNKKKNPELVRLIGLQLPKSGSPNRGLNERVMTPEDVVNKNTTGDAKSNKAKKPEKAMTREAVQSMVDDIQAEWPGGINVVQSITDLPLDAQRNMESSGAGIVRGMYRPKDRSIWLIADNLASRKDAEEILMHELVGHAGLRALLGKDLESFLNTLYDTGVIKDAQLAPIAENYGLNLKKTEDRLMALEEYIAHTAQYGNERPTLMRRVIARIRNILRKLGFATNWTDDDLRVLIDKHRTLEVEQILDAADMAVQVMNKKAAEKTESTTGEVDASPDLYSAAGEVKSAFGRIFNRSKEDPFKVNAINSHVSEFARLRGFWDSASDVLRRLPAFKDLAGKVDQFYDQTRQRLGDLNKIMDPVQRKIRKLNNKEQKQVHAEFRDYMAARENGRKAEAEKMLLDGHGLTRELVDAWQKVADLTGEQNQSAGVRVFDAKEKKWRLIGKLKTFWPRAMNEDVMKAMHNPSRHTETWKRMAQELFNAGRIEQNTIEAADDYLSRELGSDFNEKSRDDYFAGIEKARTAALPEFFYDYSYDAAVNYMNDWAENISRIEAFGQASVEPDAFMEATKLTRDQRTKDYIMRVRDRVYNTRENNPYVSIMGILNGIATGIMLGNPATAMLNLIGGTALNFQAYGMIPGIKATASTLANLSQEIKSARELGILIDDYTSVLNDMDKYGAGRILQTTTSNLMKYGGYTPMETFIRTHGFVMGRQMLRKALGSWRQKIDSAESLRYLAWYQRNGFDTNKLIAENGSGPETNRLFRYQVNLTQGSYKVNQTPVFVDSPIGRFLFKYQKFGTQLSRMFWINHLKPFIKSVAEGGETVTYTKGGKEYSARVRTFLPMLRFFGVAILAGATLATVREAVFGYNNPAPDLDELEKALENDDTARALTLAVSKAWNSMMAVGALGFFGNYLQMVRDVADRQRVKSPIDPPGLSPIKGIAEMALRSAEQGGLTARDWNEFAEGQLSLYRTARRATLTSLQFTDFDAAQLEQARRDRTYTRTIIRRYANEIGLENKRRAPDRYGKTEMSNTNQRVIDALLLGDSQRAAAIVADHVSGMQTRGEIESALTSVKAAVRSAMPTRVSLSPSQRERTDFLAWAEHNLSERGFDRIKELDDAYHHAAVAAGLMARQDNPSTIAQQRRQLAQRGIEVSDPLSYLRRQGVRVVQ